MWPSLSCKIFHKWKTKCSPTTAKKRLYLLKDGLGRYYYKCSATTLGSCAVLLAAAPAFIGCFKSVVSGRRLDENCWPPDWADLLTGNFQRKGFRPFVCRANVEQRPRERLSNVLKKIFVLEVYCSVSFIAWQWFGSNSTRKVFKMTAWKRRPIDSLIYISKKGQWR